MTATRIRCTETDLTAAYAALGLDGAIAADTPPLSTLHNPSLVDQTGSLTPAATRVLPIVADPQRIITVTSIGPGDSVPHTTTIVAQRGDGPFVFRGDNGSDIDLVAVDSPTEATALLDEMLMITALPGRGPGANLTIGPITWFGLLAAADAVRASRLEAQLDRAPDPTPTLDPARITIASTEGIDSRDPRWLVGAVAAVDPSLSERAAPDASEIIASIEQEGLAYRERDSYAFTDSGLVWIMALVEPIRVSHIRVVEMLDRQPTDTGAITLVRSPVAVVIARRVRGDITISADHPDVIAAMIRALIAGSDADRQTADGDREATVTHSAPNEPATPEWVYTTEPLPVLGLQNTSETVGTMRPGIWYELIDSDEQWAHVADADTAVAGWVPVAQVHRRSDVAETALDPEPIPVAVETEPAWAVSHTVPGEGIQAWAAPDPAGPVIATLAGGVELQVVEQQGDWADVRAENGWEAWVDGRRLVAAGTSMHTPTAAPLAATSEAQAVGRPGLKAWTGGGINLKALADGSIDLATVRTRGVQLAATVAILISVFLSWAGGSGNAFDIPIAFLFKLDVEPSGFSLGIALLILAVASAVVVLVGNPRHQMIAGGVAVGITAVFLLQYVRILTMVSESFFTAVATLFTQGFGIAPWLLLAAGVTLLVRR